MSATHLAQLETAKRAVKIEVVSELHDTSPLLTTAADGRFVLVLLSERSQEWFTAERARSWLNRGAAYVCAWGPGADRVEEAFDHASFLPEFGDELPFTLLTTSHRDQPLEEALWFAFYCASPPADLDDPLSNILLLADSVALKIRCEEWLQKVDD